MPRRVSYASMQFKLKAPIIGFDSDIYDSNTDFTEAHFCSPSFGREGEVFECERYAVVKIDMGMFNFPLLLSPEPLTLCSSGSQNAQLLLSARTER